METKRCNKCILPEKLPGISFNSEGTCNHCIDYEKEWKHRDYIQAKSELDEIISNIKKLNRKYDCLIPVSGGKDSIYTLYYAKTFLNLNILAVNFDNRFQSEVAIDNIYNATNKLGIDVAIFKPNWETQKQLIRAFLINAGEFCTPCNVGIRMTMIQTAKHYNIPLIFTGISPQNDGFFAGRGIYTYSAAYFLKLLKAHGLNDLIKGTLYDDLQPDDDLLLVNEGKRVISLEALQKLTRPFLLDLPYYLEWKEKDIFNTIESKLNWKVAEKIGKEHTDCALTPVKSYLKYQHSGCAGDKTLKYAALVRTGQANRKDALDAIKLENQEPKEFLMLLDKLEIDHSLIPQILSNTQQKYL
ncbi:MAG: N-acetyl sugar amidotransferase [Desulfobacterales bacterium]|nr:N-acetyl sugar amidotransferase [Desulfobacterales bacterium]